MAYRWTTSRRIAAATGLAALVAARVAGAQPTCDDVDKLRATFNDAYKDEQEKRYAPALEKFRAVERCRPSASVRYRIGAVLEAQGHLKEARDVFRAIASGDRSDPKAKEIFASADERAADLDKRIPKLVVKTPAGAPEGTVVTVDGVAVPADAKPIELDPGEHVVEAKAPGAKPFESRVKLGERGEVSLPVILETAGSPKPLPPPPSDDHHGEEVERPRTLAYVALAAGGALVVTSVVMLVVRKSDIDDIHKRCPNVDACPAAESGPVGADRSQAKLFLPLGVGIGALGLAAAGAGAYLLLRPATEGNGAAAPKRGPSYDLHVGRGGAILGVRTAF